MEDLGLSTPLESFYRNRTVLVTGHTGFKGSWLVTWLKMLGANVVGYALGPEPEAETLFESACVKRGMTSVIGDIRDLPHLTSVFQTYKPEVVFHLAAQPLVRRSYREPADTFATNVMGTVNLLEAVRLTPSVASAVVVTSDKCYENREWLWSYREDEPMGGHDPYSASKGCAELVTASYRRSFFQTFGGPAVASARAGNVIGGGDWAEDRIVPDIMRSIATGAPFTLRNPGAIRPWQHVLEPVRGYLLLGHRLAVDRESFAGAWNFGPRDEDACSVQELAELVAHFWEPFGLAVDGAQLPDLHEAHYLKLDSSKARAKLKWKPLLTLNEAVDMTVNWYRTVLEDHTRAPHALEAQIRSYADKVHVRLEEVVPAP